MVLAQSCHSSTDQATTPACSAEVLTNAQARIQGALMGNVGCDANSDCVLVPTPCSIASTCAFEVSAVNVGSQAAVEHAFSIIGAEVCGSCTTEVAQLDEDEEVHCESDVPAAMCSAGQCAVVSVPPSVGDFGFACTPTCGSDEYCEIESAITPCGAPDYYILVNTSGGECLTSGLGVPTVGDHCNEDSNCGVGFSCIMSDAGVGLCGFCPDEAERPTSCDGGCELTTNNHGCNVCYCPSGCPDLPDGG